jgi:hypothetical protein
VALVALGLVVFAGCGQDEVKFPDTSAAGGECGPWYPGGGGDADAGVDGGAEVDYAIEEGAIFPCAVWESAMLNGAETFINVGQIYLEAKHGQSDTRAIVIVVSARNCTNCIALINAIADRAAQFEEAGAYMIVMARRDQYAMTDPDLTLDQAYEVAVEDGWPVESWPVINDEEYYFSSSFDNVAPWVIVVGVEEMMVGVANTSTFVGEQGVIDLLAYLNGPDFQ